jgi:drug/metabolite transporter (DMT)-like permease
MFAGGFATMALDEQFQGHEQIRELILVPRGIFTGFDFMIPGDIVLILYVFGGLAATWFLLDELKRPPASLALFIVAVAMIGISAVQDALAFEAMDHQSFRRVQTIVEELLEIWAQLLFATSFLLILSRKFHRLLRHVADGGRAG